MQALHSFFGLGSFFAPFLESLIGEQSYIVFSILSLIIGFIVFFTKSPNVADLKT
jgi:hypothetical protein